MYPDECVTNQGRGIGHASNHTISISYSNRNTVCAIICGCFDFLSILMDRLVRNVGMATQTTVSI